MVNSQFDLAGPMAVVCANDAQFNEFMSYVVPEHRSRFVQVSLPSHIIGRKFSEFIQLYGTDAVPYQRLIRVLKGERLQLPKPGDMKRRGWAGMDLGRKDKG